MKRNILLIFVLVFIVASAHAQQGSKAAISFGGDVVFPLHSRFNTGEGPQNFYNTGGGFALKAELPGSKHLALTVSAGYMTYGSKPLYYPFSPICAGCTVRTAPETNPPYEYIPLKAGLRYYFGQVYFEGEAGAGIKANFKTRTAFIYGGGAGWAIPFNPHDGLDIGAHLDRGFKSINYNVAFNQLDVSLAYRRRF